MYFLVNSKDLEELFKLYESNSMMVMLCTLFVLMFLKICDFLRVTDNLGMFVILLFKCMVDMKWFLTFFGMVVFLFMSLYRILGQKGNFFV